MINQLAIIDKNAKIGNNVTIGPYTIIGKDVEIGDGTVIGPHVIIEGKTKIGKNNRIFQFAALGAEPQHLMYRGEDTTLEIGDNNTIREFCSIHRGTTQGHSITRIGNKNYLMCYVHIAHDCVLGNENVFANNASLAGHVEVGSYTVLSAFTKVLQFCLLGDYCFVGANTDINKDILPYIYAFGSAESSTRVYGLNLVGLRRRGFSRETLISLKDAYNIIFRKNLTAEQAIQELEKMIVTCPEVQLFINMLKTSTKGIMR